jgi:hypothetical protein
MKLAKVIRVLNTCVTVEQMATTILWAGRVLSSEEGRYFFHLAQHAPNFDIAIQIAKNQYIADM